MRSHPARRQALAELGLPSNWLPRPGKAAQGTINSSIPIQQHSASPILPRHYLARLSLTRYRRQLHSLIPQGRANARNLRDWQDLAKIYDISVNHCSQLGVLKRPSDWLPGTMNQYTVKSRSAAAGVASATHHARNRTQGENKFMTAAKTTYCTVW